VTGRPDVLVVGAGVVGAACVRFLAGEGLRVRVLEAGRAGGGATAAGMGHVTVMDDSEAQFELTRYSLRLLEGEAERFPPRVELDRCGTIWLAEDDEDLRLIRAKAQAYGSREIRTEVLSGPELYREEPQLRPGLAGGMFVPGEAVVYPPALAHWLLEEAKAAGAEVHEGVPVECIGAGWVRAGGERVDAGLVVNAAGAAAALLTPGLPVVPRKGHLVITERYPGFCHHQLMELGYQRSAHGMDAESIAFNVQPRRTGQLIIGSSRELVGWDLGVNRALVSRMLDRARYFLPELARLSAIRTWTGLRPATPDKLPLIGPWPRAERVWIAAGHEGLGITTALATGRMLADLVTGRTPGIDPTPFDPRRVLEA
jgi:D-hydroxyproline dehydrogenase subunit beta